MTEEQRKILEEMSCKDWRRTLDESEACSAALAELSSMQAAEKLMRTTNERLSGRVAELEAEVAQRHAGREQQMKEMEVAYRSMELLHRTERERAERLEAEVARLTKQLSDEPACDLET